MDNYHYQNMAYCAAPYQQHPQYAQYQQYQTYQQPQHQRTNQPSPPWRATTRSMANAGVAKHQARQVDSWRSYSTDTTNLQTTTANLNAAAPAFEPTSPPNSTFKPYESLRVSNGTAERKIVEAYNAAQVQPRSKRGRKPKTKAAPLPSIPDDNFTSRYPVRSTRGVADLALPSIEKGEDAPIHTNLPIRHVNARATRTKSPEAPVATPTYLVAALEKPVRLAEPRKLLVILDLNGTLLYRNRSAGTSHLRPGVAPFIDYIFNNHTVMVYTSATPEKAQIMVNSFLHPSHRKKLAGFWARDKLELTSAQYRNKVQVYKKLDKIWNDSTIQKSAQFGTEWDQSNTILIDDSQLKALSQPHNLVQVPEYKSQDDPRKAGKLGSTAYDAAYKVQIEIMQELERKIEDLKYQEDVSRLIRQWQSEETEVKEPEKDSAWTAVNQKKAETVTRTHLPTPESLADEESEGGVELQTPEVEESAHRDRSGSVSSIDESVFRELLGGKDK